MMAAVTVAATMTTRRRKRSMVFLLVVLWSGVTVVEAFTVTTLAGGNTAAAAAAASCRCCLLSKAEADDADAGGVGVRTRIEETPTPSPLSSLNRRAVLSKLGHEATSVTAAVMTTTLLAPTTVTSAATGGDGGGADDVTTFERVIPQSDFLAQIATGPVRTIVVTGANSGVGLAGAKFLVAAGHRVILACRTQAKADAAAHACYEYAENSAGDATTRREGGLAIGAECDLASLHSIRTFAQARIAEATASGNGIDTLVLNAGLAHGQGETDVVYRTVEGFEETVGVNHLGHFLLANLLVETVANSKLGGKIVSTASSVHDPTSGGGKVGLPATLGTLDGMKKNGAAFTMVDDGPYDPDKAYKDSKLCNVLFMEEAARRWGTNGGSGKGSITVNAFSPGLIVSSEGFFRNQNPLFSKVFNIATKLFGVAETNDFGGAALAYMAVDPSLATATGGFYDSSPPGKHQLAKHPPSREAQNSQEQQLLWEVSSKLVGI